MSEEVEEEEDRMGEGIFPSDSIARHVTEFPDDYTDLDKPFYQYHKPLWDKPVIRGILSKREIDIYRKGVDAEMYTYIIRHPDENIGLDDFIKAQLLSIAASSQAKDGRTLFALLRVTDGKAVEKTRR